MRPRQGRSRRKKQPLMEVDITSLLDILVILLVFLLKNYNASGVVLNVPKGVTLPKSESITLSSPGTMVQVSKEKIWVDSLLIADKSKNMRMDYGGRRIVSLYNDLVAKKKTIKMIEKSSKDAKKFSGMINLIVDKEVRYTYLRKILFTCAEAGYKKYKFVVLGEE